MMQLIYFVPVLAWLAFVSTQYHHGDRPTTVLWYAGMAGIGTFECGKGFFGLAEGMPATTMALAAGLFAAGCVLAVHARQSARGESAEIVDAPDPEDGATVGGR